SPPFRRGNPGTLADAPHPTLIVTRDFGLSRRALPPRMERSSMNKRMIQMLGTVVLVIAILGFVKYRQISAALAGNKSFSPPPEAVTTVIAQQAEWSNTLDAVGSIAPVQGVMLSADLPGVVSKVNFASGAHVKEGQVLVELDTRQERAQLASAEAQRDLA